MQNLSEILSPIEVMLDEILLDPNNPRFAELGEELDVVPEGRFAETKIQRESFERMKNPRFDVAELRDTIKTIGFLQMDRIVIREWHGVKSNGKKYVVVEGNRRVCALKWLIELHESGKETFTVEQRSNFTKFEALLLD